jgi:hypothetical protein
MVKTIVTITPTAEDIERQTRRLEEMEQEANNNNWLSTLHEFVLSYPWYRMHLVFAPLGAKGFDVGLSPFLLQIRLNLQRPSAR